jgi:hypothetical protein
MFSHRFANLFRGTAAAGLLATSVAAVLPAPEPAHAQYPNPRDHRNGGPVAARVQVVLNSIKVINDRDGTLAGAGEFELWYQLRCSAEVGGMCPESAGTVLEAFTTKFSADSGETYPLDIDFPKIAPMHPDSDVSPRNGYPLRPGVHYELETGMTEFDGISNDENMGRTRIQLTRENGFGIGVHSVKALNRDQTGFGDYIANFEIKRMPFPDLRAADVKITDLPGSTRSRVCATVQELNAVNAGPFDVSFYIPGSTPFDARAQSSGQAAGQTKEYCVEGQLPTVGVSMLRVIVNGGNAVTEYDETNNMIEKPYVPTIREGEPTPTSTRTPTDDTPKPTTDTPKPTTDSPTPTADPKKPESDPGKPSNTREARADLTVNTLKVNGQAPDGKGDCKEGANNVSVLVKNQGKAKADGFTVRLAVDGAKDGSEQSIKGLDAGQEREVKFGDVKLKKGQHTLVATVDPDKDDGEADGSNNSITVKVTCGA